MWKRFGLHRLRWIMPQIFILLLLGSVPGAAREAATAQETPVVQASPALWKLDRKEGAGEVYLFGSFHILPRDLNWFDGAVGTAFQEVEELVLETNLTPEAQSEIAMLVMSRSMLPAGYSLQALIGEAGFARAVELSGPLGLGEAQLARLQPWYLALTLSVQAIMAHGLDPESGVEKVLQRLAAARGTTISGLETPREQIMALSEHPLEVQAAMLTDTLDKLSDFKTYMDSYIEAWATGQDQVIADRMVEDMKEYPGMYQALLVERNKNWLPRLEEVIQSGKSVMVVVGAAHLVGQDGLVRLLREAGYTVTKVQ